MSFRLLADDSEIPAPRPKQQPQSLAQQAGSFASEAVRPAARLATNVAAVGAGFPGDLAQLFNDWAVSPAISKVSGQPQLPYEKTPLSSVLPTSEKLQKSFRSVAPEYLSPRNKGEEFVDTVVDDAARLFLPQGKIKGFLNLGSKLLRAFGVSLGANLAGETIKDLSGGDKEKAAYTKLGSMFLLSLFDKPKAAQYASDLYKQAEAALPQGAKTNASALESQLHNLKTKVSKGTLAPSEKFVADEADAILSKIRNGEIAIDEAWAAKRSLNEKLYEQLYKTPEKAARARAKKLAGTIQHDLSATLGDYAKRNPKFGEPFKSAEEAFGAIAKSRLISRFIEDKLTFKPSTEGLLHLVGSAVGGAASAAGTAALGASLGTAAAAGAAYPVATLAHRAINSPVLRKHYLNTIKAAAQQDSVAFNRELRNLDEAFQKEKKKDTFRIID